MLLPAHASAPKVEPIVSQKRVFGCGYEVSADYVVGSNPDKLPGFRVASYQFAAVGVARDPSMVFGDGEIISGKLDPVAYLACVVWRCEDNFCSDRA